MVLGRSGRTVGWGVRWLTNEWHCPVCGHHPTVLGRFASEVVCDWCANWAEAEVAHAKWKRHERWVEAWGSYTVTSSPLCRWLRGEKGVLG